MGIPSIAGIIPMAGKASRLGNIPFSKELYPLGYAGNRIKVVSEHLMESMALAGAEHLHIVLRNGKWDIPAFYGSDFGTSTSIAYHIARYEYGVPFTVHQAYPFIKDKFVLLGFPDILFEPRDAFLSLHHKLMNSKAMVGLGLFPVTNPCKYDMVGLDQQERIREIQIKPVSTGYHYAWIIAAWKPEFNAFIHEYIQMQLMSKSTDELESLELHFGNILISAIEKGMHIMGVKFEDGRSIDIGTPEDLANCRRYFSADTSIG